MPPDSPPGAETSPAGVQAEGAAYRPHERSSRLRFQAPPTPVLLVSTLLLALALPFLAFSDLLASSSTLLARELLFLVPAVLGAILTPPLARGLGGKFSYRRATFLSLTGLAIVALTLLLWRLLSLLLGAYDVEGPLLLGFALTFWIRQLTLVGLSHRSAYRSFPASAAFPGLGFAMVWYELGSSGLFLLEGVAFLLLAFGATQALVTAVDRPLEREFGEGGVSLLRPLMEHMSDREPAASSRMERFFEGISTTADLRVSLLAFHAPEGGPARVACVVPSVHPGPFAELGSSDLPRKVATALRGPRATEVLVPHSPSTHAQDLPSAAAVARLTQAVGELVASATSGPSRASTLVSPHPGSIARAQVFGDAVWVVLTQAPAPTDDIDYALAEMVRDRGRQLGFRHVHVVDAHNSFAENRGEVPFGSPQGYRLLADAEAAMRAAAAAAREGPVRVGFARRGSYTPERDGIAGEGLSVLVVEASGARVAYALFDANNLVEGLRDPLVRVLSEAVGGQGEVLTTDNHVVHEVRGGTNTLGQRRGVAQLSADLREVAATAVASLAPVEVRSGETMVPALPVLGAGVITRLMTAIADSFALFWLFFLASFALIALTGALLLALVR